MASVCPHTSISSIFANPMAVVSAYASSSFATSYPSYFLNDKLHCKPNVKCYRQDSGCVSQHYLKYLSATEKKQQPIKPCYACTKHKNTQKMQFFFCVSCDERHLMNILLDNLCPFVTLFFVCFDLYSKLSYCN